MLIITPYEFGKEWKPDLSDDNPLKHVNLKLSRAIEHTIAMRKILEGLGESDFIRCICKFYGNQRAVMEIASIKPMPDRIPILVGEVVHQLRTSLDHIMFLLCKNAPESKHRHIQFRFLL